VEAADKAITLVIVVEIFFWTFAIANGAQF